MRSTFLKCGWLSSSQNISLVGDSGLTFSPSAIEIDSFSHDAFTKIVSLALHLYVFREFSLNSMFEVSSILLKFAFMFPVTSNTNAVVYCKINWTRNV